MKKIFKKITIISPILFLLIYTITVYNFRNSDVIKLALEEASKNQEIQKILEDSKLNMWGLNVSKRGGSKKAVYHIRIPLKHNNQKLVLKTTLKNTKNNPELKTTMLKIYQGNQLLLKDKLLNP